ncbi:8651_t:CDS:2 [Diversispora eburnea]|uniref:8651_t:CDS:1 n=1 Tax=Diversispora eburnea TaxID=1213867 RepID=A0A9N9G4V3_9GLOM|nr:8651_t:CDS:2 [Diversispora eburnea]
MTEFEGECVFMDIDDEWTLQDITLQIEEFRKDKLSGIQYENSSMTLSPEASFAFADSLLVPYVVVDTNFLISHLAFLKKIIMEHAKESKLFVIIPWIVLQELDGLKSRPSKTYDSPKNSQPNLQKLAENAIYFLHSCLIDKLNGIRGQRLDEKLEKHDDGDIIMMDCDDSLQSYSSSLNHNEDHHNHFNLILSSLNDSIYSMSSYKDRIQGNEKEIKSNNKNSKIQEIRLVDPPKAVMDCDDSINGVLNLHLPESSLYASIHARGNSRDLDKFVVNNTDNVNNNSNSRIRETEIMSIMISKIPEVPKKILSNNINMCHQQLIIKVISYLNDSLPVAILTHFQNCFGQDWTYLVNIPQPWSLHSMLKFIDRYWLTVFSDVFQRSRKIHEVTISNLLNFVRDYHQKGYNNINITIQDLLQFIQNSEVVLTMIYEGVEDIRFPASDRKKIIEGWWDEFENSIASI